MKTLRLLPLLIFISSISMAQLPSEAEAALGLKIGYTATDYGKKKDRNDGFFKQFDFVWKQNDNLYVVKKKIKLKNGDGTQNAWLVDKNGKYLTKMTDTGLPHSQ